MAEIYTLRNEKARKVKEGSLEAVIDHVKHDCPDGVYSLIGPDADCTLDVGYGSVYPTTGRIGHHRFLPREMAEASKIRGYKEEIEPGKKNYAVIGFKYHVYPVDLRTHPKDKVRFARKGFRRKFAEWEEARLFAINFNRGMIDGYRPKEFTEDDWQGEIELIQETVLYIQNAIWPNDPVYVEWIMENGLV